ncbi:hypothetical protein ACFOY2_48755 [Nonomuraea purpurea]|uniref:Uncharacterized protein n=1 Tax=Nonomuraea purpurea TaxID=1849276 RepID=A0ABV8GQX4_9ACTN
MGDGRHASVRAARAGKLGRALRNADRSVIRTDRIKADRPHFFGELRVRSMNVHRRRPEHCREHMSRLEAQVEESIKVDGHQFMLVDPDGAPGQPEGAVSFPDLADMSGPAAWFVATANLAIVTSAHQWHLADVTLELWDGKPPVDDSEWAKNATARLYSSSGKVRLAQILGSPSEKVMNLGREGGTWAVEASCRPGSGWRRRAPQPPEGLESFRLRLWPTAG